MTAREALATATDPAHRAHLERRIRGLVAMLEACGDSPRR